MFLPTDLGRARDALALAQANAAEAEKLAGGLSGWFSSLVGADSANAAARADAHSTRALADALSARFDRMFASPGYETTAAVNDFVTACGSTDVVTLRETANTLSATTAAADIGAGMAHDAAEVVGDTLQAAGNVGGVLLTLIRVGPYLLAALAVVIGFAWAKKARAKLGV